jgi:hypothetical protein
MRGKGHFKRGSERQDSRDVFPKEEKQFSYVIYNAVRTLM